MEKKLQVTITSQYPQLAAHFRAFVGNKSAEACRLLELGRLAGTLPKLIQRTLADGLRDLPLTVASSVADSGDGEDAQAAARLGGAVGGYFDEDD